MTDLRNVRNEIAFYLMLILGVAAFQTSGFANDPDRRQMNAIRIETVAPRMDGILDDDAWQGAEFVSGFLQKDPNEGEPAMHKTEVAILYDDDAIYVGGRMFFDNPDEIKAFVTRRDNSGSSERLIVSLDTYLDRRTAYSFVVTAAGVRTDYFHPSDHEYDREFTFNPVWEAKTTIHNEGWSAEMRIPFSQLRFSKADEQVWGINVNRWIPNTNEDLYWVLINKEDTGWSSKFGDLTGIRGIAPSRRIELLPYSASSAKYTSNTDPLDPFNDGSKYDSRIGMDFKMGLGPNLTLDATINPDFGQVEADPAVVNLTAFETFFDEKRPFFIEGNQLFDNIGPTFFYSRRIGAPPHGGANGDFVNTPENTTILGAAKLSGRLNSGLSIGALTAVTSRENADTFVAGSDSTPAVRGNTVVEPVTAYGVVRLQQEFGPSSSYVGLMLTSVNRDMSTGSRLASILNRQAYTGNLDWNLRFQSGKYVLSGFTGFSHIKGDAAAITAVQRSSAHYFQRPDADYVTLDSTRTSLTGYAASVRFNKNSGEHWLWNTGVTVESPALELNDAGILSTADGISPWAELIYRETRPGAFYRNYRLSAAAYYEWNFGGTRTFGIYDFFLENTLKNFWRILLHYHFRPASQSQSLTRGGPLMGSPSDQHLRAELFGNPARNINWGASISYVWDELGGFNFSTGAEFSFKPADPLEISFEPEYQRQRNRQQYFTEIEGGRAETFGNRYIFSHINRSTLSTEVRVNYAITPDLSLEVYAEPFAASGDRFNFGELLAPKSQELRLYGTDGTTVSENADGSLTVQDGADQFTLDNGDFNIVSFRSNFVLRWEWRRGSTFFLVWQQDRFAFEEHGRFVRPGRLFDSLSEDGDNFFALKFSYWLPVN